VYREKATQEKTELPYNTELLDILKKLRVEVSREEELPPFAIFSDRSLFEMATYFPQQNQDFLAINGVGRFKLDQYGKRFLAAIKDFCIKHGIQPVTPSGVNPIPVIRSLGLAGVESMAESFRLFLQKKPLEEIARARGLVKSTIIQHICMHLESGAHKEPVEFDWFVSKERQGRINQAIDQVGTAKLSPIKLLLPDDYSYEEIRLVATLRMIAKHH